MKTAKEISDDIHLKLCHYRSLYYVVSGLDFEQAYNKANESTKGKMLSAVESGNVKELSAIIEITLGSCLEEMPVRELRRIAGKYGIANYHLLPKASLLSAIKQREFNGNNAVADSHAAAPAEGESTGGRPGQTDG